MLTCKVFADFKTFSFLEFEKRWSRLYNAFTIIYSFCFSAFVYVFLPPTLTELNQAGARSFYDGPGPYIAKQYQHCHSHLLLLSI